MLKNAKKSAEDTMWLPLLLRRVARLEHLSAPQKNGASSPQPH